MPSVLRQSGAKWVKDGETITPRAVVHFCERCSFEGAPFGTTENGKREYFCGFADGQPQCIGKGTKG